MSIVKLSFEINKAPKRAFIEDLRYVISQTNVTDMYNLKE